MALNKTETEDVPDRIMEAFEGLEILVTGGTGFLGKVLVEKFLRDLPNVRKIYLLVRPKKGKDPKVRVEEILNSALFEKVRKQRGLSVLQNVVTMVNGDVCQPDLGLSEEDRKMLCERVNVVYHAAATVRFDETLKFAVILNVRGTRLMLDLAKEMKGLKLFAHVSTAYCHIDEKILQEKLYAPPADPDSILKYVEWMPDDIVEALTQKILAGFPNCYAFTKALAEKLVEQAMADIPATILRPSVIIPIWKEPLPGWTDNMNGPVGLLIGAGMGVIRTMYCQPNGYADYVPADIAVNAIIVATWDRIACNSSSPVYNITSSSEIKVTWGEMIDIGRKCVQKIPLNGTVWYPGGSIKSSRLHHNICAFFFHFLPACLIDTILFVLGFKPVMLRVFRRINKGFDVFEYYANNVWEFQSENLITIRNTLNAKESEKYKLKGDNVNIVEYFEDCIRSTRIHMLKQPVETLPAARRHLRVMYWVDVIARILFFAFVVYLLSSWFEPVRSVLRETWSMGTQVLPL